MTDDIISDIKKKFELLEVYEVDWSSEFFPNNMSRFYGIKLPPGAFKENQHDVGSFLLCIIEDKNPKYNHVETPNGKIHVNSNTYDAKQTYRLWTGGGNDIHSSNTEEETEHDLTLLLGKNLNDIKNNLPKFWNGQFKKINRDLIGYNGWDNLEQLFYVLNATINYVVLRNFENLLDNYTLENNDIDILSDDLSEIEFITNKQQPIDERPYVKIADQKILFDFRDPSDEYYDERWSNEILNCRVLSPQGFYVPNSENHFYSLLYHMLIHKGKLSDVYIEKLRILTSELKIQNITQEILSNFQDIKTILDGYMRKMGYYYMPRDYSVTYSSEILDFINTKREHRLFKEKLKTKNWQQVAAEIYLPNKPWNYEMIVNQNRSDFLFLLDIKKDDLALVIGADLGQIVLPLSRFCNVIALENDPDKIDIMKMIAKQENQNNIQFVMSNIHETKFETGKFNLVIINDFEKTHSLENEDQIINQSEILNESYRILKFGGTLYFGAINKFGLKYLLGENVDGLQDYIYLKNDFAKSIFEAKTGEKLRTLPHGKKEYEKMILKSGFKNIDFFGNLRDHRLSYSWIDLSNNQSSKFVANNMYFLDDYDVSNKTLSKYNEKLKNLYEIFSDQMNDLYSSYSIVAQK
jgi:ubiquinone/menaquinone biosynthesis C-methylase UbiE